MSSITKSSSSGPTKAVADHEAAPVRLWHQSLAFAFLLVSLTSLVIVLYETKDNSRLNQPTVVTLADDVDESALRGGKPVRHVVRHLPPASGEGEEEEPQGIGAQHPRVKATRGADLDTTSPSNEDDLQDNSTESMDAPQAFAEIELRRPSPPAEKKSANATSDRCASAARFTVCSWHNREEFFFDAEKNECRSKALVRPPPCLSGRNRFKNFRECRLACLDQTAESRCRTEPLFQWCTPEDISRQWWYLKDGACHLWKFPHSNCVSPRLALFGSREACHSLCVAGHPVARHPACSETPVEHACTAVHMIYPVQARPFKDRLTCVQPDPSEPKCLTGRNRFRTEKSCRQACLQT